MGRCMLVWRVVPEMLKCGNGQEVIGLRSVETPRTEAGH